MIKNHKLWAFWTWCLLKASHKDIKITVGYQDIELKTGQFIFGRKRASSELNMTEREIRTCLKHLIFCEKMTIKTTNRFSIISIINWGIYQQSDFQTDQQNDQQVTSNRPASDHKQECKEQKNEKKKEDIYNNIYMSGSVQKNGHFQKFISFFNNETGTKYRATKKIESQFKARIEEGFTIQDIEKAVMNAKTDAFLMGKNDRNTRYLTPEFILRPDKLDKWINHIPIQPDNRISENGKKLLETMKRMEERGAFN
jgi:uncharacterized phage protein (TIGR02220 family)